MILAKTRAGLTVAGPRFFQKENLAVAKARLPTMCTDVKITFGIWYHSEAFPSETSLKVNPVIGDNLNAPFLWTGCGFLEAPPVICDKTFQNAGSHERQERPAVKRPRISTVLGAVPALTQQAQIVVFLQKKLNGTISNCRRPV